MILQYDSDNDYLFIENNQIIGECSLSFKENLYIEWIEIYEPFRKMGYLKEMFSILLKEFKTDTLEFYSKYELVNMYKHLGSTITKVIDQKGSADMIFQKQKRKTGGDYK